MRLIPATPLILGLLLLGMLGSLAAIAQAAEVVGTASRTVTLNPEEVVEAHSNLGIEAGRGSGLETVMVTKMNGIL